MGAEDRAEQTAGNAEGLAMGNWSQGAQGAAGGAAMGTAILPGWGTAIGAGVGGLLGYFGGSSSPTPGGYDRREEDLLREIAAAQGRGAEQVGPGERSAGGMEFRTGQQDLIRQLQAQARGQGPSLAGMQAYAAMDRGMAQQQSLAAGAAPGNEALAARQAMQNSGGLAASTAMTAAQARAAEQMSAQQLLGGALQGARGQDIQNEQFNAGWTNTNNATNAHLRAGQRAQNDSYGLGLRGYDLQNGMGAITPANQYGTQLMSGGAGALAMYGTGAFGSGGAFGQSQVPHGAADLPPGGQVPSSGPGSRSPYTPRPGY